MICLLNGHAEKTYPGVGPYEGRMFSVCVHCGRTEEVGPATARAPLPSMPSAVPPAIAREVG